MEYYFDELDPSRFQRLIHALLQAHYGTQLRTGPLRGADGGLDAEVVLDDGNRWLFQVKHHRATDANVGKLRSNVVGELHRELAKNESRLRKEKGDRFILVTNVPSSAASLLLQLKGAEELLVEAEGATIWWQSDVVALIDRTPSVWAAFPEIFAGAIVPMLGRVAQMSSRGPAAALRAAMADRYTAEKQVKFRQIDLDRDLASLFIDVNHANASWEVVFEHFLPKSGRNWSGKTRIWRGAGLSLSAKHLPSLADAEQHLLNTLMGESAVEQRERYLIEAGPGHGKSTVTQMLAQIYRQELLGRKDFQPEGRWQPPSKLRIPIRIELRQFAEWLADNDGSLEQYTSRQIARQSGGQTFTVDDLLATLETSPAFLICDGLDEIGSDRLRDRVLDALTEMLARIDATAAADLKVVLTSRPPAIAGRRERLTNFTRIELGPLSDERVSEYADRWLNVHIHDEDERATISAALASRRRESHVAALARNPMQLAILLHLMRMKGAAFPNRRAELYREYFRTVIDRDVEKNPSLTDVRVHIEALHRYLAFEIHARAEAGQSDGTLPRAQLMELTDAWMREHVTVGAASESLFRIGEERLGLIVASRGEGSETRYGFELQPIREYFAAAYVSEDVSGDAHEAFIEMIQRPFWQEVAAFIAGLRRPNERADLISRSRDLDARPDMMRWQFGRSMTLKLLKDGVFREPRYLFESAMDYVSEKLDRTLTPLQAANPIEDYSHTLAWLGQSTHSVSLEQRLYQLLQRVASSPDIEEVRQVLSVAAGILSEEEVQAAIMAYPPSDEECVAAARAQWSTALHVPLKSQSKRKSFWSVASPEAWASALLDASRDDDVTGLQLPATLHEPLLTAFAGRERLGTSFPWSAHSRLLAWNFLEFERTTSITLRVRFDRDSMESELPRLVEAGFRQLSRRLGKANTAGLSDATAGPLRNLAVAAAEVLTRWSHKHAGDHSVTHAYAEQVIRCTEIPGLVSLVAARHALSMIVLIGGSEMGRVSVAIEPFFSEKIDIPSLTPLGTAFEVVRAFDRSPMADRVRVGPEQQPVPIADLLTDAVLDGRALPFPFLSSYGVT